MSVDWNVVSAQAVAFFGLALLVTAGRVHAQGGGGRSCGSHGGGHGGGSHAGHLSGAHGGTAHGPLGADDGARAWGGHTGHSGRGSSRAALGASDSLGANHGSHSTFVGRAHNNVLSHIPSSGVNPAAGLTQVRMWPSQFTLSPYASNPNADLGRFQMGMDAARHGHSPAPLSGQHLGHVGLSQGPTIGRMTPSGVDGVRQLGLNPIARPMPSVARTSGGSLVRENILRRAYGRPARPWQSLAPLVNLDDTVRGRSPALPDLTALRDGCYGKSSTPAVVREERNMAIHQADEGAVGRQKPASISRATQPPVTPAPVVEATSSSANGEHVHPHGSKP